MKKIYVKILKIFVYTICLYSEFCGVSRADVCASNQIDLGNGECVESKFSVTTTNLSAGDEFRFYMSAQGTFYIDCGDGGELSGVGVSGVTVTRTNTNEALYTCAYTTGGVKTIRFAGRATGYSTNVYVASIRFGYDTADSATPSLVAEIDGSIGQIMHTLINNKMPNFRSVFAKCSELVSVPELLFDGVALCRYGLFANSFEGCLKLRTLPERLFAGISCAAGDQFIRTFQNCKSLQSIPKGLFKNIFNTETYMFYGTFSNCSSLQNIPDDLFSGIINISAYAFVRTFSNCTNLSGHIPPSLFAGLIINGSSYELSGNGAMYNIFAGTNLATTCPAGTVQFMTGYEDYWGGRVACVDENLVCGAGQYLPSHWYQCESCPENNYCVGGTYSYSESIASGATQCPNNLYSPAGMSSADQCGRILHIGDNVVYLRSVKKTTPSLNVDIDNDGIADFFGNMTTSDVVMNSSTDKKLKIQFGGQTYSVYDDTVGVGE